MSCINTYTPSLTQYLSELQSKCKDELHPFLLGQHVLSFQAQTNIIASIIFLESKIHDQLSYLLSS
jgi:hypothetical protein